MSVTPQGGSTLLFETNSAKKHISDHVNTVQDSLHALDLCTMNNRK